MQSQLCHYQITSTHLSVLTRLLNTLFKHKPKKEKKNSYTRSKSYFGLAYCKYFFTFDGKFSMLWKFCVTLYSEYRPLTGFELSF